MSAGATPSSLASQIAANMSSGAEARLPTFTQTGLIGDNRGSVADVRGETSAFASVIPSMRDAAGGEVIDGQNAVTTTPNDARSTAGPTRPGTERDAAAETAPNGVAAGDASQQQDPIAGAAAAERDQEAAGKEEVQDSAMFSGTDPAIFFMAAGAFAGSWIYKRRLARRRLQNPDVQDSLFKSDSWLKKLLFRA